jgi:hypothetical protein
MFVQRLAVWAALALRASVFNSGPTSIPTDIAISVGGRSTKIMTKGLKKVPCMEWLMIVRISHSQVTNNIQYKRTERALAARFRIIGPIREMFPTLFFL